MNMIFCFAFVSTPNAPKEMGEAIGLLKKANMMAFRNQNDMEIFINLLKEKVSEVHAETKAYLCICGDLKKGGSLILKRWTDDNDFTKGYIASMSFLPIDKVVSYDMDARDFFEIDIFKQEGGESC